MKEIIRRHRLPRRHLAWVGFLITLIGVLSYFMVFAMIPGTRDIPWVNLPLVLLGGFLAVRGTLGWRQREGALRRWLTMLSGVLSIALVALFVSYIFLLSYQVPEPSDKASTMAEAIDFSLPDTQGNNVSLTDFPDRRIVISFFRGYW